MHKEYTIFFDSRDRVDSSNPPWKFRCNLESLNVGALKNIQSVEILAVSFPRIKNEDYVIFNITELPTDIYTSIQGQAEVGAVFFFDNYNLPTNQVKAIKGSDFYKKCLTFQPCVPQLTHMTFEFCKHGGDLSLEDFDAATYEEIKPITVLLKICAL